MDHKRIIGGNSSTRTPFTSSRPDGAGERALRPFFPASAAFSARPVPYRSSVAGYFPVVRLTVANEKWVVARLRTLRAGAQATAQTPSPSSFKAPPLEEPQGLDGYVLHDSATSQLGELIRRIQPELDEVTGSLVVLNHVGNPAEIGSAYGPMRDARLRGEDEEGSRAFRREQKTGAPADFIVRREAHEFVKLTGFGRTQLPCIAFITRPPWVRPALLRIRPDWIVEASAVEFSRALVDFFRGDRVEQLVRKCRTSEELTRLFEHAINDHIVTQLDTARLIGSSACPILLLDEIRDGESNRAVPARIVGSNRLEGVNKKIGARQLFFAYLLFQSKREHAVDGERMTVITLREAIEKLARWSELKYLNFTGQDEDRPAYRIQRMWHDFVRRMERVEPLRGLFTSFEGPSGEKLFALRLPPNEKEVRIADIDALFAKVRH